MEGAEHRRARGHPAEQAGLDARMLDLRRALPTPGRPKRHLDEDLAPIMHWHALPGPEDASQQRSAAPQAVGRAPTCVQAEDTGSARLYHPRRACAFSFEGRSRMGSCGLELPQLPFKGGSFRRRGPVGSRGNVNARA